MNALRLRTSRANGGRWFYRGMVIAVTVGILAMTTLMPAPRATAGPASPSQRLTELHPKPQQVQAVGPSVPLRPRVNVIAGAGTDAAAVSAVRAILTDAGVKVTVSTQADRYGTHVYVGTLADNPALRDVLGGLGVDSAHGLAADGYVLATGLYHHRPVVVLNGVDGRGTFYAAQTLRQLMRGRTVLSVHIRDWPLMSIRGAIEGFYGIPWSHQARLDQFVFYGRNKMNTYIYTPKDDPLLRKVAHLVFGTCPGSDPRRCLNRKGQPRRLHLRAVTG